MKNLHLSSYYTYCTCTYYVNISLNFSSFYFLKLLKSSIPHHTWCCNLKKRNSIQCQMAECNMICILYRHCLSLASVIIFCVISVVKTDTWNVFTGDIIPKHTLALETSEMCGIVNNNALQELTKTLLFGPQWLWFPPFSCTQQGENNKNLAKKNMSILNHTPNQATV